MATTTIEAVHLRPWQDSVALIGGPWEVIMSRSHSRPQTRKNQANISNFRHQWVDLSKSFRRPMGLTSKSTNQGFLSQFSTQQIQGFCQVWHGFCAFPMVFPTFFQHTKMSHLQAQVAFSFDLLRFGRELGTSAARAMNNHQVHLITRPTLEVASGICSPSFEATQKRCLQHLTTI